MKRFGTWFMWNLATPTMMILIGVAFAVQYQLGEINPGNYQLLAANWSKLSGPTRVDIAQTMSAHDRIRNWDYYPRIFDSLLNDTGGFSIPHEHKPLDVEKAELLQKIKDQP